MNWMVSLPVVPLTANAVLPGFNGSETRATMPARTWVVASALVLPDSTLPTLSVANTVKTGRCDRPSRGRRPLSWRLMQTRRMLCRRSKRRTYMNRCLNHWRRRQPWRRPRCRARERFGRERRDVAGGRACVEGVEDRRGVHGIVGVKDDGCVGVYGRPGRRKGLGADGVVHKAPAIAGIVVGRQKAVKERHIARGAVNG